MPLLMTAALYQAIKGPTGFSLHDARRAIQIAETTFQGDIVAGIGYMEIDAGAVCRIGLAENLPRYARAWADERRDTPEWQDLLRLTA